MGKEVIEKIDRVRSLMKTNGLEGVLLTYTPNFFWITGGKSGFVDKGVQNAAVKIFITFNEAYVVCNSSEKYRILEEELTDGSFQSITFKWHESEEEVLRPYLEGKKIGSDSGVYGTEKVEQEIQKLRYCLTEDERIRMREMGVKGAEILEDTMRSIVPGETEWEVAGRVTGRLMSAGYQVPVCLVASDERVYKYRHPLPTDKKIEKYAMIAICAQKYGLTVSASRLVSFGPLSEEIKRKYEALLKIDATYILNTKAGALSREILQKAHKVYEEEGYEADFHLHHQGGALGYLTRDYCTNYSTEEIVQDHQGYSWNPTISGVKLEDTYLIEGERQEIVSETGKWVYRDIVINGQSIRRPDILIKE